MDMVMLRRSKIEMGFELLADIKVENSPVSIIDIEGLNIQKGDELFMVFEYVRGSGAAGTVNIRCDQNGTLVTSSSSYYFQELSGDGTSPGGYRYNDSCFSFAGAVGRKTVGTAKLKLTNSGHFVWQEQMCRDVGSGIILYDVTGCSTFTTNSITKLRLHNSLTSNMFAVGTRVQLYKL